MLDSTQPAPMLDDPSQGIPTTSRTLIERAIRTWTDQLVDLSGRNGLLHYRDLPVGTLDLASAEPAALEILLQGGKTRLSVLYPDSEVLKTSARRCRKIREKAKENLEERGIDTLYLVAGLATWTPPPGTAAIPAAPILLHRVELTPRGAAGEDFDLTVVSEAELNPTLFYALEAQFGIHIDSQSIKAAAARADGLAIDAEAIFGALESAGRPAPGFAVAGRTVLGNFSYTKLPMVEDLKGHPDALVAHVLIAAIAGDIEARKVVRERQVAVDPRELDAVPAASELLVLDADASQQSAIESIIRGSDAVIQGPPGTGKSQTIANLIASATGRGQRVLFVAEKRAAIDAVVGRLNQVGLADLVLDLHGGVKSRRRLAENLSAALGAARGTPAQDATVVLNGLEARKKLLGAHAKAVNEPHMPWGISLFQAESRALAAADLDIDIRLPTSATDAIPAARLEVFKETLREYLALGAAGLRDDTHPWSSAGSVDMQMVESLSAGTIELAHGALANSAQLSRAVATEAGVTVPITIGATGELASITEDRTSLAASLDDAAFDAAERLAPLLAPARRGLLRRLVASLTSSSYRAALKEARGLARDADLTPTEVADLMSAASDLTTRWTVLATVGAAPPLVASAGAFAVAWARTQALIEEIRRAIPSFAADDTSIDSLEVSVAGLERDLGTLRKLPRIQELGRMQSEAGLAAVLEVISARRLAIPDALRALDGIWARGVCDRILARSPEAGGLDATRLTEEEMSFGQLDREHIRLTAARVKRAWALRAVAARDTYPEQDTLVSAQAKRKIGHLPVRELFAQAPDVLTAVKPCWAMSPLLVSQILPADRPYFDLVVFDEASQILPADAIPSILRGHRTVVAGDDLQLPPTTFFASHTADDREHEGEPLDGEAQSMASGYESILDIADPLIGSQPLRWHYRSRDERLIAFSNLHIYRPKHRELTTFPAVSDDDCIRHVRVATRLDRTDGQSSTEEVKAVVELILEHAAGRPTETLGVIAMGIKHAERIGEALRLARMVRPDLDGFFTEGGPEPFFVKNLERVQGDERDAIILTIGYTPGPDGRLRQQFGPINQQGGERRLNVAITRAKRRICVVSSFGSEDVDPARSVSAGVKILQGYLRFAESRGADLGDVVAPRPELNGFERDVMSALDEMGIEAVPQLGTSGYVLDFALQHPTKPGRFVLAVECDGASYHAAPNTRERDRLRQQQLEAIGWRFHRIWSTDWFRDRDSEAARLLTAYRMAVEASPGLRAAGPAASIPRPEPEGTLATTIARARGPRPLVRHYKSIDFVPRTMVDSVVLWIESDGLLRTEDEVVAEATTVLGFQRRGRKINDAIEASVNRVRRQDRGA